MNSVLFVNIYAQKNIIFNGVIYDQETKKSIPFASIKNVNTLQNTTSNESGDFTIDIISETDSIYINCVGYSELRIGKKDYHSDRKDTFFLKPYIHNLESVTLLTTKLSWGEIMFKALQTINEVSQTPFESNVLRSTSISRNGNIVVDFSLEGYGHDEGFDGKQIIQNRLDPTWYIYHNYLIRKQEKIIDYTGYRINASTYFEKRAIKQLFPISFTHYNYALNGIETNGTDTMYKISVTPNLDKISSLRFIDKRLNKPFYSILLAKKTIYIQSKTFKILKIDFGDTFSSPIDRNDVIFSGISGSVTFNTINGNYHPLAINIKHFYKQNGIDFIRNDQIAFQNIQPINLSNDQLKAKYQLNDIKGDFPGRRAYLNDQIFSKNEIFNFHGIILK